MKKLKEFIGEDIDYLDYSNYFNNNKFKLSKNFIKYYNKKYGKDVRFDNPEKNWLGKLVKIYKVKPNDTQIQISWKTKYAIFNDYSPAWSIIIPIKDIFKYNLFTKV